MVSLIYVFIEAPLITAAATAGFVVTAIVSLAAVFLEVHLVTAVVFLLFHLQLFF